MDLMDRIKNSKGRIIIAIDGPCASGKSTLAQELAITFNGYVFHMDDFFLSETQKTKERLSEIGGNVDYERFLNEVLSNLRNDALTFKKFNCNIQDFEENLTIKLPRVIIVEGSYAMHPKLRDYYDIKVFLKINPKEQLARLKKRNPKLLNRFIDEWIPLENIYFTTEKIEKMSDIVITI